MTNSLSWKNFLFHNRIKLILTIKQIEPWQLTLLRFKRLFMMSLSRIRMLDSRNSLTFTAPSIYCPPSQSKDICAVARNWFAWQMYISVKMTICMHLSSTVDSLCRYLFFGTLFCSDLNLSCIKKNWSLFLEKIKTHPEYSSCDKSQLNPILKVFLILRGAIWLNFI